MNKIEQIKAEIERLYDGEAPKHDQQCDFDDGYFTGIGAISKFLDTLEEPEDVYSVNESMQKFIKDADTDAEQERRFRAYKAFWDAMDHESELVCEELEEAADNHIREVADAAGHPGWDWETQDIADAFIAGAKWQKEKMMDDAVEGEVCILPGGVAYVREHHNEALKQYILDNFKTGDKVRIIIVKEDNNE